MIDLSVRKKVAEILGYKLYRGRSKFVRKPQWHFATSDKHPYFDPHGFDVLPISEATDKEMEKCPAYEHDANASRELRQAMAMLGWNYDIGRYGSIPAIFTCQLYRDGVRHSETSDIGEEHVFALCCISAFGKAGE